MFYTISAKVVINLRIVVVGSSTVGLSALESFVFWYTSNNLICLRILSLNLILWFFLATLEFVYFIFTTFTTQPTLDLHETGICVIYFYCFYHTAHTWFSTTWFSCQMMKFSKQMRRKTNWPNLFFLGGIFFSGSF